jgi:hypothetical protein
MGSSQKKAVFCLSTIGLFLGLAILYYYLDDYLDEGRSFLYLNTYNQGLLTWWWDFTWFWGYFELSIVKACIIAAYLLYFMPKSAIVKDSPNKWVSLWLCIGILIIGILFSHSSPGYPERYDAGAILWYGWYQTYFARHLLELIQLGTGFWMLPLIIRLDLKKIQIQRNKSALLSLGVMISVILLHMSLVGLYSVKDILNLVHPLESIVSLIGFILPITFGTLLIQIKFIDQKNPESATAEFGQTQKSSFIGRSDYLWLFGSFLLLLLVVGVGFWSELDTAIEIPSRFIPNMFFSNLFTGALSSIVILFILKNKTKQISEAEK